MRLGRRTLIVALSTLAVVGCGSGNALDKKVSQAYGEKVSHCRYDDEATQISNGLTGTDTVRTDKVYDCRVPTGTGSGSHENWRVTPITLDRNGKLVQDDAGDGSSSAVGPDGSVSGDLGP